MSCTREQFVDYLSQASASCDSLKIAGAFQCDHNIIVGHVKALEAVQAISTEQEQNSQNKLTAEAENILVNGSPEMVLARHIKAQAVTKDALEETFGKDLVKVGWGKMLKNKWVTLDKETQKVTVNDGVCLDKDAAQEQLQAVKAGTASAEALKELKSRKLLKLENVSVYRITKNADFEKLARARKPVTALTEEMMRNAASDGSWKDQTFKPLNFRAMGPPIRAGQLHPLLKVREHYRRAFFQMGFSEMPTDQFVESSFWNFDTLFQPQQHPARDAHDTFFLESPASANEEKIPKDYLELVQKTHEQGGYGSTGWKYSWSKKESLKNIMRTHTTAVTSRVLYRLAQEMKKNGGKFRPMKCFSVDRVFRNETVDATHLAEFHQAEGVVAGENLTLGNLIATLTEFFSYLGITKLEYKPAYNPYTEPSMEIFGFHEGLGKLIEIGNSGVFRPEMLRPMGLPENVQVIAWGLSLERPTMMLYGIDHIRDLFSEKLDVATTLKKNPVAWFNEPDMRVRGQGRD